MSDAPELPEGWEWTVVGAVKSGRYPETVEIDGCDLCVTIDDFDAYDSCSVPIDVVVAVLRKAGKI